MFLNILINYDLVDSMLNFEFIWFCKVYEEYICQKSDIYLTKWENKMT